MDFNKFLNVLEIKEEYQIKDALFKVLFSNQKDVFLDKLIKSGFDVNKDEIREIFENELANRKTLKQDYTPSCICKLISCLCDKQQTVLDICGGVGSLSIQTFIDGNSNNLVIEELSDVSISLLLLNLSIRNIEATVYQKDVLTQEIFNVYRLTKSKKYSDIVLLDKNLIFNQYDCIISNPPYSLQWEPFNDERFWSYYLAPKAKADYAFVLDALYRINDNGSAYIILPHGVLFRGAAEEKIRKAMIQDNVIDCIIGLPENLFLNTGIPVIILCLKKNRQYKDVLFIDASKQFNKVGKQNVLSDDHIQKIINTYHERKTIEKYSKIVSSDEIKDNGYNLNIPRYIDTFEEKEPVDIKKSIDEIIELENEIHDIDLELAKMLVELQGNSEYEVSKQELIKHLTDRYVHDVSNALNKIYKFMQSEERLKNHITVKLLDIAEIERSKKNKVYKKGSSLIQLSATRGQMEYLESDSSVDSKYGVIIPTADINPKYLYFMLTMNMPKFLSIYQTGLNIVPDVFKFMKLEIHTDASVQDKISKMLIEVENIEHEYSEEIEKWKDVKGYHLDNMFV